MARRRSCIGILVFFLLGLLGPSGPNAAQAVEEEIARRSVVVRVAEAASPAVVNISTEVVSDRRMNPFHGFRSSPFFEEFFRDFFESPSRSQSSLGSGVIIGSDGTILTNEHVILQAAKIKVTLLDGREFEGKLIGSDPESDLAVIRVIGERRFPAIKMGTSEDLMIGETVIAIGNPFGLSHTVTAGVVSSLHRSIKSGSRIYRDFIQTDASINPGNSGGPLLNIAGELVGINTAIYREGQGIGFAIPIDRVKRIVDDLIAYGEVHSAWVGIQVQDLTPSLQKSFHHTGKGGVVVTCLSPGGPGEEGGIDRGDIIERVGQVDILSPDDYTYALRQFTAGDAIDFGIFRKGRRFGLSVRGVDFPLEHGLRLAKSVLGVDVEEIDDSMIRKYGLQTDLGVVVTSVDPSKVLGRIGVQPGDVIRQVGDRTITNIKDYQKAMHMLEMRRNVLFQIQRGPWASYATVDVWGDRG